MRRDKTVARIFLIFSVVEAVLAAPAGVRQGHLGVAEDVAAASVKRGEPNLTPSAPSTSSAGKAPQLPPSGVEAQEDKHLTSSASSLELEDPEFEAMMMRMKASANPWGASDTSSVHSSWDYDSALDRDVQSLPSTRYGTPPMSPRPPIKVTWPEQVVTSYHEYDTSDTTSEAEHEVSPASPPGSSHENAAPTSSTGSPHQGTPPDSPSGPSHQDFAPESPATAPKPNKFLSGGLKENAKVVAAAGAVFGAYIGVLQGIKVIDDKVSSRAETVGRDLTSSDVVGRGAGTHSRPGKNSVSRGLANSRDEDLRLLDVLTRRVLEKLD